MGDLSSACCCSCCSKSAPTLVEYLILRCIVYSRPHDFQSISFNQSIEKQVKESQNAILNNPHPRGRRLLRPPRTHLPSHLSPALLLVHHSTSHGLLRLERLIPFRWYWDKVRVRIWIPLRRLLPTSKTPAPTSGPPPPPSQTVPATPSKSSTTAIQTS